MITRRLFVKYLSVIPLIGVLGFPKPKYYRETVPLGDDLYSALSLQYSKALSRAMTHTKRSMRVYYG